jgi:hypothetical protein
MILIYTENDSKIGSRRRESSLYFSLLDFLKVYIKDGK